MKRWIAILLAALLLLSLGTGCKKATDTDKGAEVDKTPFAATGRYVESEIALPLPEGCARQMILGMAEGADGLAVYTASYLGEEADWRCRYFRHTVAADGTVTTASEAWMDELAPFGGNELHVLAGATGTPYLCFSDYDEAGNSQTHLLQGSVDGQSGAAIPGDAASRNGMLTSFGVLDDGSLALADFYEGTLYLADREGVRTGELDPGGKGRINGCAAGGQKVAFTVPEASLVRVYDAENKTYADYTYDFSEDSMALLAVQPDGTVYLIDRTGVYRHAADGTLWELIVDGATSTLGLPSFYPAAFLVAADGAYPAFYVDGGDSVLCYRYDAAAAATADKSLTVFSLVACDTVRQGIVAFSRARPDVKITYKIAMDGETAGTEQDYINALNTELLAGTGPDILILDGLPLDSYMEKDVLADLTAAVSGAEPMLDNVRKAAERDGALYAVPTGFRVPLAVGPGDVEETFGTLSALADAAEQAGETPLLSSCAFSYETLANYLFRYYGGALLAGDAASVSAFLQDGKRIAAATGCTDRLGVGWNALADMTQEELRELVLDWGAVPQIVSCLTGNAEAVLSQPFGSVQACMELFAMAEQRGASMASVGGQYVPVGVVGVNKASAEQEAAAAFVETLLSSEAQGGNPYADEFPVNKQALSTMLAYENDGVSSGFTLDDGGDFTALWPTKLWRDRLGATIDTLDTPIARDAALSDMLLPTIAECFSGAVTEAEAAERIQSLLATYLSE